MRATTALFVTICALAGSGCGQASVVEAAPAEDAVKPQAPAEPSAEDAEPLPTQSQAPEVVLPQTPENWQAAVEQATEIHADHRRTFFCNCVYTSEGRTARGTCGYQTRADDGAAKRIAWERVVPVRTFGSHRGCWKTAACTADDGSAYGGLRCCRETDPEFRAMETDLHNVVPIIAELQQDRSNYHLGEVEGEARLYGACDVEIDRGTGVIELPEERRGDAARVYLYMFETYGAKALPLSMQEIQQLRSWAEVDPPDEWEQEREARITKLQGSAKIAG